MSNGGLNPYWVQNAYGGLNSGSAPNSLLQTYATKVNPSGEAAALAQNVASSGISGAATGAAIGGAVGSVVPIVGNILGAMGGAVVGGIFDLINGSQNRKAAEKAQREAREMAERQFAWGQKVDLFNMNIGARQQNEAEKAQRHAMTQQQIDRLNQTLRSNAEMQNHVRSLWGGR